MAYIGNSKGYDLSVACYVFITSILLIAVSSIAVDFYSGDTAKRNNYIFAGIMVACGCISLISSFFFLYFSIKQFA
jgi:hypothetical protein